MWIKKFLNEGNQIHNFISSSGSGTVINYGSGSDFFTNYGSGSTTLTVSQIKRDEWMNELSNINELLLL